MVAMSEYKRGLFGLGGGLCSTDCQCSFKCIYILEGLVVNRHNLLLIDFATHMGLSDNN